MSHFELKTEDVLFGILMVLITALMGLLFIYKGCPWKNI